MNFLKQIGFASLLLAGAATANAFTLTTNPLSISSFAVTPGEEDELVMNFDTEENYIGLEFELTLPEGVAFMMDPDDETEVDVVVTNTRLAKNHTLAAKLHPDGLYKAVFFSMTNAVIKSGSWLLKIPIKVSDNFSGSGSGTLKCCRYATDTHEDQYLKTDYFDIYVAPTSIKLSQNAVDLGTDEKATLTVTYLPESAAKLALMWSSSDETVATVDENGNVTGISEGEATITAALADNPEIKDSCKVTVANTTGIELILGDAEVADVYDLNGNLLLQSAQIATIRQLKAGIYIIGGYKVQLKK